MAATDTPDIAVVPANEASWEDLQAVLGERGTPQWCQCQWFKFSNAEFDALDGSERRQQFAAQTGCGDPAASSTSGLVAYVDGEPAGWCAVEPRTAYPRLQTSRLVWAGRDEDRDDASVWSVTCFVTRKSHRRQGIGTALARAALDLARGRGATAVEGYPLLPRTDGRVGSGDLYVGTVGMFESAGFIEISRPTDRRAVMRADF